MSLLQQSETCLIEEYPDIGPMGFRVRWTYTDYWARVEAFEYVCSDAGGSNKQFGGKEEIFPPVDSIDEAGAYLTGSLKWDGCCHIDLHDNHFCGAESFQMHCVLLETLYKRSQQLIKHAGAPWGVQRSSSPLTVTGDL